MAPVIAAHAGIAPAGLRAPGDAGAAGAARCTGGDAGAAGAGIYASVDGGSLDVLTTGQPGSTSIAVDGTNVYWTTSDSVVGLPLAGGPPVVLATKQLEPHGLAVDGTSVYWANIDGSVMKAPIEGGAWTLLATGRSYSLYAEGRSLAVDSTSVYWTNPGLGQVLSVPLAGGRVVVVASGQYLAGPIAVSAGSVYFVTDTSIMVVPISGGPPATIATGAVVAFVNAIAVDSSSVYWTNRNTGDVMSTTLAGGNPHAVASQYDGAPGDLAVDATGIYWLQRSRSVNEQQLLYVPLAGGPRTTLWSKVPSDLDLRALDLDCTQVYVTGSSLTGATATAGVVLAVPK
jgi:hypothetical protein